MMPDAMLGALPVALRPQCSGICVLAMHGRTDGLTSTHPPLYRYRLLTRTHAYSERRSTCECGRRTCRARRRPTGTGGDHVKPPTVPVYIRIGNRPEVQIGAIVGTQIEFGPQFWQAQALREAADDLYSDNGPGHPLSVATWLRERAHRLEHTP